MANFGVKILNNAVSALAAQQAVIATTGNNIANVNTPGYARREISLETNYGRESNGGIAVGNGVRIGALQRITDTFLEKLMRDALGTQGSTQVENEFLSRIENLYSLTGDRNTIGSTLSGFFTSLNDLSANPASIELRANVMQRAQDLVSSIKDTFNTLASLQREADQRISTEIQTVNSITAQIANLNGQIRVREANGASGSAADERDARDQLLRELSEKISFTTTEVNDGTINIALGNGFPIVSGDTSRALATEVDPSFSGGTQPPALDGGLLNYIVFDYGNGVVPGHVDLTQTLQGGTGTIAGLLRMRGYNDPGNTTAFEANGTIVEMASRVEAITRELLTTFNDAYLGGDRDPGAAFAPRARDLDQLPPGTFGFFDFAYTGTKDQAGAGAGRPEESDLDAIVASSTTRNFSSILTLNFTDPRRLAAALTDSDVPDPVTFSPGDGRNLTNLTTLRTQPHNFVGGNFTLTGTFDDLYQESVSHLGNLKASSDVAFSVAQDNVNSTSDRRDQISAVSLDEEFTSLITFQKAYQASARMIRVADELLEQILQIL